MWRTPVWLTGLVVFLVACGWGEAPNSESLADLYSTQAVRVAVPAAWQGAPLTVTGPFGTQPVGQDEAAQVPGMQGMTPLLVLTDEKEQPLLLGWQGGGTLDAASTAAALVYYALGLQQVPDPELKGKLRSELGGWKSLEPLEQAIQQALDAGEPLNDAAILTALQGTLSALAASPAAVKSLGLQVNPAAQKSGIDANLGTNNALWFTNSYLRPAKAVIQREYYIDAAGQQVAAFKPDVASLSIPKITTLPGVVSTLTQYFALPPEQRDTVGGLMPQSSPTTTLENMPGAKKTVYTAYVYGPGLRPGEESKLSAEMQADYNDMAVKFFMTDVFFTYLGDMTGSLFSKLGDSPEAQAVINKFTTKTIALVPTVVPLIKVGNYQEAISTILTAVLTDGDLQNEFLRLVFLNYLLESKRLGQGGFAASAIPSLTADSSAAFQKYKAITGGFTTIKGILGSKYIKAMDEVLKGLNLAALVSSVAASERAFTLTLTAIDPKVLLSTDRTELDVSNPAHLKAKLADQDAALNEGGVLIYRWSLSSGDPSLGYLHLDQDGRELSPGGSSGDSSSATAAFQPLGLDGEITVTVEMYVKNPATQTKTYLGTDSLKLSMVSMMVALGPGSADLHLPALCEPQRYADRTALTFQVKNTGSIPVTYQVTGAELLGTGSGDLPGNSSKDVSVFVGIPGAVTAQVQFKASSGQSKTLTYSGKITLDPNPNCKPPNPDPSQPDGPSPVGGGGGDPHMRTFDGYTYDFQGVGDYVLTRSAGFEVQARFERTAPGSNVSVTTGLAANVLGDRIEVYRVNGALQTFLNGTLLNADSAQKLPGGGALVSSAQKVSVAHPDGSWAAFDAGYTAQVQLAAGRKRQAVGLLGASDGNAGNDLKLPDGTPASVADLYGQFRSGWNVRMYSPQAIFNHGSELWDAFFPAGAVTLDSLDPAKRQAAEAICMARGIVTKSVLDGCVYDVVITGDVGFADYAFGFDPNVPRVLVNPAVALLETGQSRLFGAWVTGLVNRDVTWTATGGSIAGNTLATYTAPSSAGNYTLTATSVERPDLSGSATAVVVQAGNATWDGGGDGKSWSDPRNWVGDTLPRATDRVVIRNTANTPVLVDGTYAMLSLDSQGPLSMSYAGQVLHLTQGGSFSGLNTTGSQGVGGTIETGGVVTFSGPNVLGQMTLTATGDGKFVATGTQTTLWNVRLSGPFENQGTVKFIGRVESGEVGGDFHNLSGATVEFDGNGQFSGNTMTLVNDGSVRCLATGNAGWNGIFSNLLNRGLIESQSNSCRVYGDGTLPNITLQGGQYEAAAGATLELSNVRLSGTLKGSGTGQVVLSGNTFIADSARLEFAGQGILRGGGWLQGFRGSGTLTNAGVLKMSWAGSTSLTLENLGTLQLDGRNGVLDSATPPTFTNRAGGVIELLGSGDIEGGSAVLNNAGIIRTSGTASDAPYLGVIYHDQGGTLDAGGSQMTVWPYPGSTLGGGQYLAGGGGTLNLGANRSELAATISGKLSGNVQGTLNVQGFLTVASGAELAFTGKGANLGASLLGTATLVNSGVLNASLTDSTASLENRGTLHIGGNISAPSGARLQFTNAAGGTVLQDSGFTLTRVDFSTLGNYVLGDPNSWLNVNDGQLSLGGTLTIGYPSSFQPALNDTRYVFYNLGAATVSGSFANVNGADFAPNRRWSVVYAPSSVTMQVVAR